MAALVILGAMNVGCQSIVDDQHPVNKGKVTLTASVNIESGSTKALTSAGVKTFAVGEQIAVVYTNTSDQTVKATSAPLTETDITGTGVNLNKRAQFTVSLDNPKEGTVQFVYPAAMVDEGGGLIGISTQDGTLATLESTYDYATANGTLTINGSTATTSTNVKLENQFAIGKFTLKDYAGTNDLITVTSVTITDGTNTYTIQTDPVAPLSWPIYVVMRPVSDDKTITITATDSDASLSYSKEVTDKALAASKMYSVGVKMVRTVNLATISNDFTANDGDVLTGTLRDGVRKKISIADGATVTLDGVTIKGTHGPNYTWAGLTCVGDATIILKDGKTNTIKGFNQDYPGIYVPDGSTLVIKGETLGTGSLDASSKQGAGIGGGYNGPNYSLHCGNITISGGNVTATGGRTAAGIGGGNAATCGNITISGGIVTAIGGEYAAGIGSGGGGCICGNITISGGTVTANGGRYAAGIGGGATGGACGNITISGGTVTATGGNEAAGIGGGYEGGECGAITITSSVVQVTATKGDGSPESIGRGKNCASCGTVTIGGTVYWGPTVANPNEYEYKNGGDTYLTQSTLVYPTPAPSAPTGAINGLFTVSDDGGTTTKQVYFSKGNLQAVGTTSSSPTSGWTWQFATHQYDYISAATANNAITGNGTISADGTVDLFGWSTNTNYFGINSSTSSDIYSGDFVDFNTIVPITNGGNAVNNGWRTLTSNEWNYLFIGRTTGGTVGSTSQARYTIATIRTDVNSGVNGIILFPDGVDIANTTDHFTTLSNVNSPSAYDTKCTSEQWTALEAKGCVFLPAAGFRQGASVKETGSYIRYWSSSPYDTSEAYMMGFYDGGLSPQDNNSRSYGYSVRLVKNAD